MTTLTPHTSKVSVVEWHPTEQGILLSASFDGTAGLTDARTQETAVRISMAQGEIEGGNWSRVNQELFSLSTDRGVVAVYDARSSAQPLHQWTAQHGTCAGLAWSPGVSGLLATGGDDKNVKLWDVAGSSPTLVTQRSMKIVSRSRGGARR